jgi:hypothetical protein
LTRAAVSSFERLQAPSSAAMRGENSVDVANDRFRKHKNVADYNQCLPKHKTNTGGSSTSGKVNMDWMVQLRTPIPEGAIRGNSPMSKRSGKSSRINTEPKVYRQEDVPKVYYKPTDAQKRQEKKPYEYKGNFQDI